MFGCAIVSPFARLLVSAIELLQGRYMLRPGAVIIQRGYYCLNPPICSIFMRRLVVREVTISSEPIELNKLLKFESMVASGGEANQVIAEGLVWVNGQVETRKRKKIVAGDIVVFGEEQIRIRV